MRAYSASQGGFIDTPDNSGTSPIGTTNNSTSLDSLQNNSDNLGQIRKIFASLMLQNPKQTTELKTVFDMLYPTPSDSEQKAIQDKKDNINSLKQALNDISQTRNDINNSGSGIQYINPLGIRSMLPSWFFGLGDKANASNTDISNLNEELFQIAGKAFTGSERKLLEGKVLNLSKNQSANNIILNDREKRIKQKLNDYGVTPDSTQGGWQ